MCPYCGDPVSAATEHAVLDAVVDHVAFIHPVKMSTLTVDNVKKPS
jgi:hypothetical protein